MNARTRLISGMIGISALALGTTVWLTGEPSDPEDFKRMPADTQPPKKEQKIRDYLPQGEVLTPRKLEAWLKQEEGLSQVNYASEDPGVQSLPLATPIAPLQVFAVTYEEDIVIETNHPWWSMHEYARVRVDGREIWLAKDSDAKGLQTITAPLDDIETWIPEVPVPRINSQIQVDDRSDPSRLEVALRYRNPRNEQVEMSFSAPRPIPENTGPNGSTFNHSQDFVSALLDISHKGLGGIDASVSFDGKPAKIRRVFGIIPVKALLRQTQAGFATASFLLESPSTADHALSLTRPAPGDTWNTRTRTPERLKLEGDGLAWETPSHRFLYRFRDGGLAGIQAWQKGQLGSPAQLQVQLSAPLPDFRRTFRGEVLRHFGVLVNGKIQGYGRLVATHADGDGATLKLLTVAPRWFENRPMETRMTRGQTPGTVEVRTSRLPAP